MRVVFGAWQSRGGAAACCASAGVKERAMKDRSAHPEGDIQTLKPIL